jgi:hypothetical protein
MRVPYIEKNCKHCPLAGTISEPCDIGYGFIRYIECLRDNEDAKEHFRKACKDKDFLWLRQGVELLHCIYAVEKKPE